MTKVRAWPAAFDVLFAISPNSFEKGPLRPVVPTFLVDTASSRTNCTRQMNAVRLARFREMRSAES
jgi:hypothetical protein